MSDADVIVTGVRLNGTFDGIELIRRIRANEATQSRPVIVLTAMVLESERRRAETAGCDAFYLKPLLPQSLLGEIHRVIALHRLRADRRESV